MMRASGLPFRSTRNDSWRSLTRARMSSSLRASSAAAIVKSITKNYNGYRPPTTTFERRSPAFLARVLLPDPEPLHEALDAFRVRRPRLVAKQGASLVDVRPRLRHVSRLIRQPLDGRRNAKRLLEPGNHLAQADGLVVPEVDHLVRRAVVLHGCAYARDDVVDVGVVSSRGTVAEYGNGLGGPHQARELVNREPRGSSIDGRTPAFAAR